MTARGAEFCKSLYFASRLWYNVTDQFDGANIAAYTGKGVIMKDHESEEMYLETILVLKGERPAVRSIDIAEKLGYAKSSVSRGVSLLQDRGYIKVADDGFIDFTEAGAKKAETIYERHNVLTKLFVTLGADEELAETNACRIEHVIDDGIFELIKKFVENVR